MADLQINVKDEITTEEHIGSRVNKVEILIDSLIKFLEEIKKELQKRNG